VCGGLGVYSGLIFGSWRSPRRPQRVSHPFVIEWLRVHGRRTCGAGVGLLAPRKGPLEQHATALDGPHKCLSSEPRGCRVSLFEVAAP